MSQARSCGWVSDEVYEDLAFARPHVGAWSLPGMAERAAVISSLSKSHAVPAFRFGWIVGPSQLAQHLSILLPVHDLWQPGLYPGWRVGGR